MFLKDGLSATIDINNTGRFDSTLGHESIKRLAKKKMSFAVGTMGDNKTPQLSICSARARDNVNAKVGGRAA